MRVLSIFGGPRKKGNTATILGWVENELKGLGHQTERINLSTKKVKGDFSFIIKHILRVNYWFVICTTPDKLDEEIKAQLSSLRSNYSPKQDPHIHF